MKQAIVILIKNKKIERIRKRFGEDIKKFKLHISLVYSFEVSDQKLLIKHINNSIIKSFKITLNKLGKSKKDYYLYLEPTKGRDSINRLYSKLNKGILKNFKNKDMPKYIPHITLGIFKTKNDINNAITELKKHKIKINYNVKSVQLLTLDNNYKIKSIKNFKLT